MITAAQRRSTSLGDVRKALLQLKYEQLAFWRNPISAIFTVGFSLVFFVIFGATSGSSFPKVLDGVSLLQYYVGTFAAFGVMSAAFTNLAFTLVVRRETGQLKRLRLSPLPVPALLGGLFMNVLVVALFQVVALFLLGHFGYGAHLPLNWLALVVALAIGVCCFGAIGVAVSTLIPNQESGAPIVNLVYFVVVFISGVYFPIAPHSGLAKFASYLPVRHFVLAVFAPMNTARGASPWAWGDLRTLVIWGAVAVFIAVRRFSFEPHHRH